MLAVGLIGCAPRRAPVPVAAAPKATASPLVPQYLDLKPGELRVVTPLLKSGGYQLRLTEQRQNGNAVTFSAGSDFLGYETARYVVRRLDGERMRIELKSVEVTREGVTSPRARPVEPLFRLPRGTRHVRLIYLVRVSQTDHDMAVVAARDEHTLEAATREVLRNPAACRERWSGNCSWVPNGIAVRVERGDGAR
jgi:hypothetical protein